MVVGVIFVFPGFSVYFRSLVYCLFALLCKLTLVVTLQWVIERSVVH